MVTVRIHRARVTDADRIGRFQTRCWDQAYRGMVPDAYLDGTTWPTRAARWRQRMETGERRVWLAVEADRLIGVASTARTSQDRGDVPELELSSIYLDAVAHGTGVAARLLAAATCGAPAHLWVFAQNLRAQRFYARHGFAPDGETRPDPDTGLEEQRWIRHAPEPIVRPDLATDAGGQDKPHHG